LATDQRPEVLPQHQSLGYQTPNTVYDSGVGGGARIVDKFVEVGQRQSAA